jgi:hypothetical protein
MSENTRNRPEIPESFTYQDSIGQAVWQSYTVSAVNFRFNGAPTVAGQYMVIGRTCFAQITVDPATGLTTYASSYVNLPISSYGIAGMATRSFDNAAATTQDVAKVILSTARVHFNELGPIGSKMQVFAIYQI